MTQFNFPTRPSKSFVKSKYPQHKGWALFLQVVRQYSDTDDLVAAKELCDYLGVKKSTLRKWGKRAGTIVTIRKDIDGLYWIGFYSPEDQKQ
jgi:hypothetical protein